eukprot:431461-Rhodomonas_salina.1
MQPASCVVLSTENEEGRRGGSEMKLSQDVLCRTTSVPSPTSQLSLCQSSVKSRRELSLHSFGGKQFYTVPGMIRSRGRLGVSAENKAPNRTKAPTPLPKLQPRVRSAHRLEIQSEREERDIACKN